MKKFFASKGTERERGWGARPMGFYISESETELKQFIKAYNLDNNDPECYYTCDEPFEIFAEESEGLNEIIRQINRTNPVNIIWKYKVCHIDSLTDIKIKSNSVDFFKKI